jgi:type IV pilus assembly protein PilV
VSNQHKSDPGRGTRRRRPAGFSLVEVMVALIVLSVGLLGIARMQSLALSSTSVASQRSMAAIEAESMAASMHENRGYWTTGDPSGATITIQGATLAVPTGAAALVAAIPTTCTPAQTSPCTPAQLAAYDLQTWATDLKGILPGDQAKIKCGTVTPVSCTINIVWAETSLAANSTQAQIQTSNPTSAVQNSTYTLYVEP